MLNNNRLYTVGYEGLDIETFIARLHHQHIKSIVDVRELPLSRKKGFSKTAFSAALAKANIAYIHMPALGCPRPIRDRYKLDRDWSTYTRDFVSYIKTQKAPVAELVKLANATTAALMCFESDYTMCHRTYVARACASSGGPEVWHLFDDAKKAYPDQRLRLAA